MLGYYLHLAWRDVLRRPAYTALIAIVLGAGSGILVSMHALLAVLSGNPAGEKSQRLVSIAIGAPEANGQPHGWMSGDTVMEIRQRLPGQTVVSMAQGLARLETEAGRSSESHLLRLAEGGFFEAFDVPLAHGRAWSAEEEEAEGSPVAVISRKLAEDIFGHQDAALGQSLKLGGRSFRIIGILGAFSPMPRYYNMRLGTHADADDIFIPQKSLAGLDDSVFVGRSCKMETGMADNTGLLASSCQWLSVWVLMRGKDARAGLESALQVLLQDEAAVDGGSRAVMRVENVDELLARTKVVPKAVQYTALIALGFFLLCLVNAAGLLLAKYLRRANEVGVRRALGASRRTIIVQFLVDAALMGVIGSAFALLFALAATGLMQQMPVDYLQRPRLDMHVLAIGLGLTSVAALLSGVFPAVWASRVAPAIQMKTE